MARSYRPVVRDQPFLLPPDMAQWLPEGHLVWFVLDVVGQLDTRRFHAGRRLGGAGREGYDPEMLLALLLYAYAVGERSSRRIERLCVDHVAFRVLCAQDPPDHTTIARFRADHEQAFAEVFTQVLRMCAAAGMVKVGVVAIDGTKIAANAARGANRTPESVRQEAERIARQIVAEAAEVDAADEAAAASRGDSDDLPPGFATRGGRAANISKALAELDRQDAEDRRADALDRSRVEALLARLEAGESHTGPCPAGVDPVRWYQARIRGIRKRLAALEGVRGQAASNRRRDTRRRLKWAEQGLARAQDQHAAGTVDLRGLPARERDRRSRKARDRGGTGRSVNVTDPDSRLMTQGSGGGSVQGYNAQVAVTDDHLVLSVHLSQDANDTNCYLPIVDGAVAAAADVDLSIGTVLADAGYFTRENLTAPGPDRLIAPGKNHEVATAAAAQPATGPPPADADEAERMRHRLREPANANLYKRRSATVEPVIAHLKDQAALRRFARRGLQAVTAELHLTAAAVNLTKLHKVAPSPS